MSRAAQIGVLVLSLFAIDCYSPNVPSGGFACEAVCPVGLECVSGICIDRPAQSPIPKTGAPYTGPREPTAWSSARACPDVDLEPNDRAADADDLTALGVHLDPTEPAPAVTLTNVAVCPEGVGDMDYFIVRNTSGALKSLTLDLTYSLRRGDLDLGIFDERGTLVAYDGSIADNGRVVSSLGAGVYYIVVAGASPTDVGPYELRITGSQSPASSP